jgi:hypothetical protein
MSRNRLLLAVAAAALIAGTGGTLAQQELNTGKEKSAPSTLSKPSPGAVQQNRSQGSSQQGSAQQGGRVGQSEHSQTSGQAPSSAGGNQPAAQRKAGEKAGDKASELKAGEKAIENKAGENTRQRQNTGQTERTNRGDRERATTGQAGPGERRENVERDRVQTDRDRVQGGRNENRTTTEGREGRASTNVTVELSSEQRTRIHDVIIRERSSPRVANVDFSLEIGTRVPRTVRLVRVPTTIIEIEPRWRGFEYFLVGDEIVIVDPNRMEIVAVIPA